MNKIYDIFTNDDQLATYLKNNIDSNYIESIDQVAIRNTIKDILKHFDLPLTNYFVDKLLIIVNAKLPLSLKNSYYNIFTYSVTDSNEDSDLYVLLSLSGYIHLLDQYGYHVNVQTVREKDVFKLDLGNPLIPLDHIPAKEYSEAIGAYAFIVSSSLLRTVKFMYKNEFDNVRSYSIFSNSTSWLKFETEMWNKIVLKRAIKLLPINSSFESLIKLDNQEYDFNLKKSKINQMATKLNNVAVKQNTLRNTKADFNFVDNK